MSQPEIGTTHLFIDHLPAPDPSCRLNDPKSCTISQIVHRYKRLITEGDRLGSRQYRFKIKNDLPLENPYFRVNLVHSMLYDHANQRLDISFIRCNIAPARIYQYLHEIYQLSDPELSDIIVKFCTMCALELELYFDAAYLYSLNSHTEPDYYGVNPLPAPPIT